MKGRCIITDASPPGTYDEPSPIRRMALTSMRVGRDRRIPGSPIIGASSTMRSNQRDPASRGRDQSRRAREAAGTQVAHGLEIFLDEFGAALEQANRAPAAWRRGPAREPQRYPVAGLQGSRHDVGWHRIGGNGNEGHDLRAR